MQFFRGSSAVYPSLGRRVAPVPHERPYQRGGVAMARYLMIAAAVVVFGTAANAGGPPPVYVVVDKVTLEPSADGAERIKIEGCFVRLEDAREYKYGKPVQGYVYLSIEPGKEKESRAAWEKWQKAAGTGKALGVGSCGEAGAFLTVKIHKPDERADKPDAVYTSDLLGRFGGLYADGDLARESPVKDLLAFAKAREQAK